MSQFALPALFALLLWWFSTGIILYLVGLSPRTYRASVGIAACLLVFALFGLAYGGQKSSWDAFLTFCCVLAVWGFVEMTFLTGYVTGSRKEACPPDSKGWQRVRFAIETIIYHELLLILSGVTIFVATGGRNFFALSLFAVLWVMRLSSKLNLFLGVPMLNAELLPPQLRHMRSYFRQKRMNPLFPFSVLGSSAVIAILVERALHDGASNYGFTAHILLASFLALGLLEHLFMFLPWPIAGLWGPQIKARAEQAAAINVAGAQSPKATPVTDLAAARSRFQGIRSSGGLL
jgi:putative photosynthetic complex assembly protein 2